MLKALELSGFKSFADRTRFDFPSGISVVVGPNGSGKSNVVDAIKWVLGSQSAKSLRGKEMTDVIFNGCPTRPAMGTGEVTLTLDNTERKLAIDSNEVHVTRRVYRSGEGEYLLNRQPCRLRDIRELLATTGITTEAYCIIEQGKVDALLQSSPRDRRVIFEEAAEISQFKAKKAVAQRRMERVEQNLLRLSDIVDEVESRLRSIRSQAGKARKYRENTDRLQLLRTELALVDWRRLTRQIDGRQAHVAELQRQVEERSTALEQAEAEAQSLEQQLEQCGEQTKAFESEASSVREQLAALQATKASLTTRRAELQAEAVRLREQLSAMTQEDASCAGTEDLRGAATQLQAAEAELAATSAAWKEHTTLADQLSAELERLLAEQERSNELRSEHQRAADRLEAERTALEVRIASLNDELVALQPRLESLLPEHAAREAELKHDQEAEAAQLAQVEAHRSQLGEAERRLVEVRRDLGRADLQHRRLESQLTRVRERIVVLSELESRLEGLDGGVQDILRMARDDSTQRFGIVHGVVADLFHVDVDSAPLVEVALGERAQHIVVASTGPLLAWLHEQPLRVAGRVGFVGLESRQPLVALDHVDLSAEPGVMGRADRFVESAPEHHGLARRLLGRTWLVDRLATALRLVQTVGRGLEFVTGDGELVASDGTLIVGPRQAATGVLSRRSELRACHEQAAELEQQLATHAEEVARLDSQRTLQERLVAESVSAYTTATGKLTECHRHTASSAAKLERVHDLQSRLTAEMREIENRIAENQRQSNHCLVSLEESRMAVHGEEAECARCEERLAAGRRRHGALQAELAERTIAMAKGEQRVEMLRQQLLQLQRSQEEREQMLSDIRSRLTGCESQIVDLEAAMGAAELRSAELESARQQHTALLARQTEVAEAIRRSRQAVIDRLRTERLQLGELQGQHHKLEVAATRLRHERQTLRDRLRDDYGIDLERQVTQQVAEQSAEVCGTETVGKEPSRRDAPFHREAVEREIAELREQINNIGAINLEALNELDELEGRFENLSGQYRDLVDAKAALERITQRINVDSRQLFLTTVETIRGHFQELFRRLFGGGEANIVVDEAEDVLESGIEIIARPPGKEACSISLLSGGEKTLTCVALLLAVFRSKPSPFCILDEVDAALDEANIGRFTAVLREFLSFTQFIVISHSKKTMSGAGTLYGVTMEESGVSKRVSVRFEDVSEDGHILPSAVFHAKQLEQAAQIEQAEQKRAA
ncbi:MAG: chromosome segregation protein SMC [Pirellulales bacterium]|nr:chromosome segregation protein SMC [Pirellulales bacterium]